MKFDRLLWSVVFARIVGTGVHLGVDARRGSVGYGGRKIWGIQTLATRMAKHIHGFVLERLNALPPTTDDLLSALEELCDEYGVDQEIFRRETEALLDDPTFWSSMDGEQRAAFLVNAFFDSLDETRVSLADAAIAIVEFLAGRDPRRAPRLPPLVEDFGFLFRAREYARVFSDNLCSGGFNNTVKRASEALLEDYTERFRSRDSGEVDDAVPAEVGPKLGLERGAGRGHLDGILMETVDKLDPANDREVRLRAIEDIIKYADEQVVPYLERYLSDPDPEVMNRAFDAILSLKGETL